MIPLCDLRKVGGSRRGCTRRVRDQRGAVIVEAALVLPVMIMIVIGIMEFGLLYSNYSTTIASTRSGARLAATQYSQAKIGTVETAEQTAALAQIVAATEADLKVMNNAEPVGMAIYRVDSSSANGAPAGGYPGENMSGGCTSRCIRYTWNPTTKKMVRQSGSWPDPQRCVIANVESIGVYVQTKHKYITGMFGQTRTIGGHTVMRLEPVPSDSC